MERLWLRFAPLTLRGAIHDSLRAVWNGWLIGRMVSWKKADTEVVRGICKVGDDGP